MDRGTDLHHRPLLVVVRYIYKGPRKRKVYIFRARSTFLRTRLRPKYILVGYVDLPGIVPQCASSLSTPPGGRPG